MIYLKSRNLLFVKPKKTAGTSFEIALSCNAEDDDIVTPIIHDDEKIRQELGGKFPVNWAWFRGAETSYRRNFRAWEKDGTWPMRFGLRSKRLYSRRAGKFFNHMTPAQIQMRTRRDFLENAFMVTMVRHPYELVVSMSAYRHAHKNLPLDLAIADTLKRKPLNDGYVFGVRKPDFVIRYEKLHEDLSSLEERFDLDLVKRLPFTKHKERKDRRPAAEILTDAQRAQIQVDYQSLFDVYEYET